MSTKLPCLHCPYWLESSILGMRWAERELAAHIRRKHPSRPTLVPTELPPGSVQSDAAALDASFTAALHCRNPNGGCQTPRVCHAVGQCDIPRPAPATIRTWASSMTFAADSPAGLVEKVRAWLAEMDRLAAMDGPTQTHGKEGTS